VTPYASPAPEFDTVNVNQIESPAFTCVLSAGFTIAMTGAATHTTAQSCSEPSVDVDTEPVLLTTPLPGQGPPVAAVVVEVMCTQKVLLPGVVPVGTVTPFWPPHVSVPEAIEHEVPQPAPWPA